MSGTDELVVTDELSLAGLQVKMDSVLGEQPVDGFVCVVCLPTAAHPLHPPRVSRRQEFNARFIDRGEIVYRSADCNCRLCISRGFERTIGYSEHRGGGARAGGRGGGTRYLASWVRAWYDFQDQTQIMQILRAPN